MKSLFTSEATSIGARSGSLSTPDASLNVDLGNPLEKGIETRSPNPETLFAGADAACYHGALLNAAERLGIKVSGTSVRALVSLVEDDAGGFSLAVELHAAIPSVDKAHGERIMQEAHRTCPYSKALRGEAPVELLLD